MMVIVFSSHEAEQVVLRYKLIYLLKSLFYKKNANNCHLKHVDTLLDWFQNMKFLGICDDVVRTTMMNCCDRNLVWFYKDWQWLWKKCGGLYDGIICGVCCFNYGNNWEEDTYKTILNVHAGIVCSQV